MPPRVQLLRPVTGVAALAVALTGALVSLPSSAEQAPPAVGDKGAKSTWTEADKSGFGTARTRASNVWFTLQRGRVSEVFYPDLSTPSVRSLELVVTGDDFADRSSDMTTRVLRPDDDSLRYTQVSLDRDGRYQVVEDVVTDPRGDALVVRARLQPLDGGHYRLWALYDPALDNGGMVSKVQVIIGSKVDQLLSINTAAATRQTSDNSWKSAQTEFIQLTQLSV